MLHEYNNGNCHVVVYADGTKVRTWEGEAKPEFPESIDLKVTDSCNLGCQFCHEKSTIHGKHALLQDTINIVKQLPAGVEIATGGGNTFAWPLLIPFLKQCQFFGLIANATVNADHVFDYRVLIEQVVREKLVRGLGVSYHGATSASSAFIVFAQLFDSLDNIVLHVIAGVDSVTDILGFIEDDKCKVLVLGYKQFGFGATYFDDKVKRNLDEWRYWVGPLMRRGFVSFDNLAIEQLQIQKRVTPETWNKHYLGDDGSFTMYIDAVRREYANTSTGTRHPIGDKSVREMFAHVRSMKG